MGKIVTGFPNCGSTGIFGFVKDTNKNNVKDVYIHIWTDTWKGLWSKSKSDTWNEDRNYEIKVTDGIAPGVWHVAVVNGKESEERLSPIVDVTSSPSCEGGGAVQWTKVDFTKNF